MSEEAQSAPSTNTLVVTTSDTPLRNFFRTSATGRIFIADNRTATCIDPMNSPFFDKMDEANFGCVSYPNGGLANNDGVDPKPVYIGGGNGWDAKLAPPVDCAAFKGDLCKVYTYNGQDFDFFWAMTAWRNRMGADAYVQVNITKGTLEQAYRKIEQCSQNLIYVQFGEECTDDFPNGAEYAKKCYEWYDAICNHFPSQKFTGIFFVPMLWKKGVGTSAKAYQWANEIASVQPIDPSQWGICQYCHLMYFIDGTGNIPHDVAEVDNAINNLLPQYAACIDNSPFVNCKVFIGQLSANEDAYTPEANKGVQYYVNAYVRMVNFFAQSLRDQRTRFIGVAYIGTDSWISKAIQVNLDFQYVSVLNKIFGGGQKMLYTSQIDPMVDIIGTYKADVYKIVMQNRKGVPVPLPASINLDGVDVPFAPEKTVAYKCERIDSVSASSYTPSTELFDYSINYFEVARP